MADGLWVKWLVVGLLMLNPILVIAKIGAPRKPLTPIDGVVGLIVNGLLVLGLLTYWP